MQQMSTVSWRLDHAIKLTHRSHERFFLLPHPYAVRAGFPHAVEQARPVPSRRDDLALGRDGVVSGSFLPKPLES
jgi:hypothetical protein